MEEVSEYPQGGDQRQDEHLVGAGGQGEREGLGSGALLEIVSSLHVPDAGVCGSEDDSQDDAPQAAVEDEDRRGDFLALGDQHVGGRAGDGAA